MSVRAPIEAQRRFHRYVAVLFAVASPALAVLEISNSDMTSSVSSIRWASYLILAVWAIWLTQRPVVDSMALILTAIWFFGTLSLIEAVYEVEVSAFDFSTTYGLVIMLGVLAATLSSGSRIIWSVAAGVTVGAWSISIGLIRTDPPQVITVRALIAIAGVVFTTGLVSRLSDQLAYSIRRYEKAARLQSAIATSSEALLVQTDTFAIYEALRALLDATAADYAYVDRTGEENGAVTWEITADATRKTALPSGGWKRGEYHEDSPIYRALSERRAIAVRLADLKGEERARYEEDGIVTEVAVPIFVGDVFRGSIGFVQYTGEREWSEDEIATLWRASHMIGAYWRRQDDQDQLKASNESKDRLLASVSHEIRTPLTAIVGLSEEIVSSRTSLDGEELDELSGIIAMQSRELAELVEDLLVASRAEFGNLSIKPDRIDLRAEVDSVVRGMSESHPTSKRIAVVGSEIHAWADPLRCRQIIRNLLTNAIRYGGERIAIMVQQHGGQAQVLVADDGSGVNAGESELIFERYYRSRQSPTQPGSVGIGLAVSRQLAEMMGGTLRYVGAADESRFELTLPMTAPESALVGPGPVNRGR
jgi:signal transduction histidine kinase